MSEGKSSTEVAVNAGGAVAGYSAEDLDALSGSVTAKIKSKDFVLPGITLAQGLSQSVADGHAHQGEFVNSLTKENYGDSFEFIVAGFFYGKAYRNNDEGFFAATQSDRIPSDWPHKDAGKLFEESDDYEDRFRELIADGTIEDWGNGPGISSTYNFVGYRPGEQDIPLRISFMRTSSSAGKKLLTLIGTDQRIWDHVYKISSSREEKNKQPYFVQEVARGGSTPDEDIKGIVELAINLKKAEAAGNIVLEGDEDAGADPKQAAPAKPQGESLDI
jgi:hypothetical protein